MKYIILINSIVNMGGGQKYCSNKVKELERRGFDVFVFSSISGEIFLNDLKKYNPLIIPELRLPPRYFNKRVCERIICNILELIKWDGKEICFFDSADIPHSEWGELLSQRVRGKHICFLIDEVFNSKTEDLDYLLFKLHRKELYGTSDQSLPRLFDGYYSVRNDERYYFNAYCTNVVDDIEYDLSKFTDSDFNIGFFGRLDKSYIIKSLERSIPLFNKHQDKQFNVILIGGAEGTNTEYTIKKLLDSVDNIRVFITGFLNPVPKKLLHFIDVCIAAAGCARVAYEAGVLTINVNTLTGESNGICGETVFLDSDGRYVDSKVVLADLLERTLFNKDEINIVNKHILGKTFEQKLKKEISWQLGLYTNDLLKDYYDIYSIKSHGINYIIVRVIVSLFGIRVLNNIVFKVLKRY